MKTLDGVLQMKVASFVDDAPRVTKDTPVATVLKLVNDNADNTVHVVDESNRLVGIVTSQDVLTALSRTRLADRISKNSATAKEIMQTVDVDKATTIARTTDTLEDVINKIRRAKVRVVPVVNAEGQPVGQVSRKSIGRNLDEALE